MATPAANVPGSRVLLRKLREIMEAAGSAQDRLDKLVSMIAATMVADVCSIYLKRGGFNELFATEGLKREAVHRTRLATGEGLVGLVAELGAPLNLADAPHHERFSYRPETGEDPFMSFLGVPIVRSERVFGVLVVQNRVARVYGDDEVEALQTIATVLAEIVASGAFGDPEALKGVEARASGAETLRGRVFSEGLAMGVAALHEPHAPLGRIIADDPVQEQKRLDAAIAQMREGLETMLHGDPGRLSGETREVLETLVMMTRDPSWERRLHDGVRAGLSADASVEAARAEHRARINAAKDPTLRERMSDFEDLDNRLLRALAGRDSLATLPPDAILIARDLGAAELLEYGGARLKGIALEEGGPTGHAAIIARSMSVPMVGRVAHLLSRIESGDPLILDGEAGALHLRPEPDVQRAYRQRLSMRSERTRAFALLRDRPAVTKDGRRIALLLNAGLALDVQHLEDTGAEGVGLFRTEFQFMVSETLPRLSSQTKLYRDVLDTAGDRPVTFRTLDLGGDKVAPYMATEREENPALGWRAIRIGLDRPALLRYQLRALVDAAQSRRLRVMFPLVTTVGEFDEARALLEREIAWSVGRGRQAPTHIEVGAMVEAPALAFSIGSLKDRADFLSVGTNDLMQYFFAADRTNPRVGERYDILSPPALRFLKAIQISAAQAGLPLSICGEAAGRPLEAMALAGLGFDRLSMPASGVGPVKQMLLSLDAGKIGAFIDERLEGEESSLRGALEQYARDAAIAL